MVLLGLTGYKRSGKDTFANVLVNEGRFTRVAFADALKREVAAYLGVCVDELEDRKEEFRSVLQLRGCTVRSRDDMYWIRAIDGRITCFRRLLVADLHRFVVSDVRFPNEAAWIREQGGQILRLRRLDSPIVTTDLHQSETSVDLIEPDYDLACAGPDVVEKAARGYLRDGLHSIPRPGVMS